MAKYSKGARKGVQSAMKRMEKGKLRIGKSNKKVTNPKQAIAIGLSEAKEKGAKVPSKKPAVKKAAPKKAAVKKSVLKKATPKKAIAVKSVKAPAKKAAPKKKAAAKKVKEQPTGTMIPLSREMVSKAATNITDEQPPVEEKSPALPVPKIDDPIMAVDKKLLAKITTRMDPKHNMQVSSVPKNSLKPSGKKPLWRR